MATTTERGQIEILCNGMGAHDDWDRNHRLAEKQGFSQEMRCQNCGKGMTEIAGWIVRYDDDTDHIVPLDSASGREAKLGNECVKRWINIHPELKASHFRKIGA